ncbi:MAG: protease TldD [Candidatus Bathyarchaeota archaeon BA1]|nr:MAG: protease TldD [Candidatus Bathyarchaeota archaeon BA1]
MLDKLSRCLEQSTADYVETRHHKRSSLYVSIRDGKMDALSNGFMEGVCFRALVNGSWGFSSTTRMGKEDIAKALQEATSLAKGSQPKKQRLAKFEEVKPYIDNYVTPMRIDPRGADREEIVGLVMETDKSVREFSKTIASDTVSLSIVDDDLAFLSSQGAQISQRIVRCYGTVMVVASKNGNITSAYENIGAQSGLEILDETPLIEAGRLAAERADRLVSVRVPPGGLFPVVLENKIVGLLAHEAVGHCAEADLVYGGSFLATKTGEKVASSIVTLVDDGRYPLGFGTMKYDDEGVPTERTVIIENGICRGYLHSRETAYQFGVPPTGNARAWTFEFDPIIRMRNTLIEPGDYSIEELAEGIKDGYFLKGGLGGQADFTGEFMFGTQEAIKIKNGKFTESFRGVTISGNAFEVLKKVDAIGKDFIIRRGMCGKEQINFVGMGGASLRTEVLLGGR